MSVVSPIKPEAWSLDKVKGNRSVKKHLRVRECTISNSPIQNGLSKTTGVPDLFPKMQTSAKVRLVLQFLKNQNSNYSTLSINPSVKDRIILTSVRKCTFGIRNGPRSLLRNVRQAYTLRLSYSVYRGNTPAEPIWWPPKTGVYFYFNQPNLA